MRAGVPIIKAGILGRWNSQNLELPEGDSTRTLDGVAIKVCAAYAAAGCPPALQHAITLECNYWAGGVICDGRWRGCERDCG